MNLRVVITRAILILALIGLCQTAWLIVYAIRHVRFVIR